MSGSGHYEIVSPRFRDLIIPDEKPVRISSGHLWTEGPVWLPASGSLLFSDIPNQVIHRWRPGGPVSVFRYPSGFANGHTTDLEGRLVSCQQGTRSITRTEHDGSITTLASEYKGKRLNSPNDVVAKSDGSIWFTDPTYGILSDYEGYKADPEQSENRVYRIDPATNALRAVANGFVQPNGLAFSRDETILYVAESGHSHDATVPTIIKKFAINQSGIPAQASIFAELTPGIPDGFRVDQHDNIWCSACDGIHCLDRTGNLLGKIRIPEVVSNLTFGGADGNQLFITATSSVFTVRVTPRSANGR